MDACGYVQRVYLGGWCTRVDTLPNMYLHFLYIRVSVYEIRREIFFAPETESDSERDPEMKRHPVLRNLDLVSK